jgi:hypothetical protein
MGRFRLSRHLLFAYRSLCFVTNMPEHTHVNAVNNHIRPHAPVGCRPQAVLVPRSAFKAGAAVGQRCQEELASLRGKKAAQMRPLRN